MPKTAVIGRLHILFLDVSSLDVSRQLLVKGFAISDILKKGAIVNVRSMSLQGESSTDKSVALVEIEEVRKAGQAVESSNDMHWLEF